MISYRLPEEELANALQEESKKAYIQPKTAELLDAASETINVLVKSIKSICEAKWISVDEQEPKSRCITCDVNGNVRMTLSLCKCGDYWVDAYMLELCGINSMWWVKKGLSDKTIKEASQRSCQTAESNRIIAWMPLPKRYFE